MEMENSEKGARGRRLNVEALREPRNMAIAAFALGAVFGLVVLGWYLFPVQWENASAEQLRPDLQVDYMRMVIDSYNLRQDDAAANARLEALGDAAAPALEAVAASPGEQSEGTIEHFQRLLGVSAEEPPAEPGEEPTGSGGGALFSSGSLLLTFCSITAVLGVALALIYYVRRRRNERGDLPIPQRAKQASRSAEAGDLPSLGDAPPLSQWMTTYVLGDDLFDDSFSIDSPGGEFMGECGVGIAETIGVGDPKRVSAFEIWLFDKMDIQTVTKVLMSSHTFRDDAARDRLSAKGEPVLAAVGAETVLETATLQLVARVVDMEYGEGALPDESFFEKATLELAVWSKT